MISVDLNNGFKLVVVQNTDPKFKKEIFIGITDGVCSYQDLVIVRPTSNDEFEVLVYADKDDKDYTNRFEIGLYKGGI